MGNVDGIASVVVLAGVGVVSAVVTSLLILFGSFLFEKKRKQFQ